MRRIVRFLPELSVLRSLLHMLCDGDEANIYSICYLIKSMMRAVLSAAKRRMCFHNPFLTAYLLVGGSLHCIQDYLCSSLKQFLRMDCHTFILCTFLV